MFRRLITIVLATSFAAHGLFGCCWHHDHSHSSAGDRSVAHVSEGRDGHGHTHHRTGGTPVEQHDADDDCEHPESGTCEGRCLFAPTQGNVKTTPDAMLFSVFFVVITNEPVASFDVEASGWRGCDDVAWTSVPHCALSQVWLI